MALTPGTYLRAPFYDAFELVNHDRGCDRIDVSVEPSFRPKDYKRALGWQCKLSPIERHGALLRAQCCSVSKNDVDRADAS